MRCLFTRDNLKKYRILNIKPCMKISVTSIQFDDILLELSSISKMWSHKTYERIFKISSFLFHDLRPDGIKFNKCWFLYGIIIRSLGLCAQYFMSELWFSRNNTVAVAAFNFHSSVAAVVETGITVILFSKSYELASVMHFCWKCHMSVKIKKSVRPNSFFKLVRSVFTTDLMLFSVLVFPTGIIAIIIQDNFPIWFTTIEFWVGYGMTLIFKTTLNMIPIILCSFFLFFSNIMNYKTNELVKLINKSVLQRPPRTPDVSLNEVAIGFEDFLLNVRMFSMEEITNTPFKYFLKWALYLLTDVNIIYLLLLTFHTW